MIAPNTHLRCTPDVEWYAARWMPLLDVALLLAAFAVLLVQIFSYSDPFDLAYFTTTGRMWREGVDPYGPAFAVFGSGNIAKDAALWVYPPQWWAIATGLSMFSNDAAVHAWKLVNLSALIIGCGLVHRVVSRGSNPVSGITIILFGVILFTADATRIGLHLGQTNALMLLGFGLLTDGLHRKTTSHAGIGLFILLLKPQFGLFFLILALTLKEGRRPAAFALAATAFACLPVLLTFGVSGTLLSAGRFLQNLSVYGGLDWNRPGELTGVSFIAAMLGLPNPSPIACIALAIILTLWLCRKSAENPVRACFFGLAAFYAIAPLHPYDLIMLPMFLLLSGGQRHWAHRWILIGVVLSWHASSSAFQYFEHSRTIDGIQIASIVQAGVATLAAAMVFFATVLGMRDGQCDLQGR